MSETTVLDVSHYARLWRGVWWTQHLVMLLSLVTGGILLGAVVVYLSGNLETLANAQIRLVMEQTGLSDAKREEGLLNIAVFYWMTRSVLQNAPATVTSILIATSVLIATYGLGCRTFRLDIVVVSLMALAVVTFLYGAALVQLTRAGVLLPDYNPASGRVQKIADPALAAICFAILIPALVLLIVQGVLALRLARHRLRPDLAPTHEITRSFGHALAIRPLRMPVMTPAGAAIHLGILGTLGGLIWWFADWIGPTLLTGPTFLLLLLISLTFQPMTMLYRAVTGETVVRSADFADIAALARQSGRLVVVAVALIVARALWRVGTRFNLRRRDQIILKEKPPVLLLRSFGDDIAGIPPNALLPRLLWRRKRLEEAIGQELAQAGPFVAIGKPGETLPQIGAHRLYVSDAEWQQVVTSYIARAEPIILIAGKTNWVQWELSNIVALRRVAHLLVVFPRSVNQERAARWENLTPAFNGTPWSAAAKTVDTADVLAILAYGDSFVAIRSRAGHESDYEAALRVAMYLMGQDAKRRQELDASERRTVCTQHEQGPRPRADG